MTLREILNEVLQYMGEGYTSNVFVSNSNSDISRMVVFANAAVSDILEAHDWSRLISEQSITVVAGTTLYDLPTDFSKYIDNTAYTNNKVVDIPSSHQVMVYDRDETYKGRIIGGQLELINVPPGTVTIRYLSAHPIESSGGASKAKFTDDNDEWLLDDQLLIRATRHRYALQTGDSSAGVAATDVQNRMKKMISADVGARTIRSRFNRYELMAPYMDTIE